MEMFFSEVQRVKQLLANDNFPIKIMEKTIVNFLIDELANYQYQSADIVKEVKENT